VIRGWMFHDGVEGHDDVPLDRLAEAIEPAASLLWVDCVEMTEDELTSLTTQLQI
jgi:hypothetical protein